MTIALKPVEHLSAAEITAIERGEPALRVRLLAHRPSLTDALRHVEAALEQCSRLDRSVREVAILTVLRRSPYEVGARIPRARQAGVSEAMIDAILDEDWTDPAFTPQQKAAFQFALQYDAGHLVHESVMAAARAAFDEEALLELAVLCGHFGAHARLSVGFGLDRIEQ